MSGFLEETALVADVDRYDETADAMVLMTIHSAKGLEFPIVFVPGFEDGLFPGMQAILAADVEMEEERRLAYVAITRAKRELFLLYAQSRLLYGRTQYNPPSRFLKEIPPEVLDDMTPPKHVMTQEERVERAKEYMKHSKYRFDEYTVGQDLFAKTPVRGGSAELDVGDRVKHVSFGEGTILSVKQMGTDKMYEVMFDKVGTKKLMATYARLKKL